MAGEMDDADLGGEGYEVSVAETLVHANGGALQPGHGRPSQRGEKAGAEGVGRGSDALNDVRLRLMDGNGDTRAVGKLSEAAGVVRVCMRDDDPADALVGDAAVPEAAHDDARASRQARIDEDGVAVLGEDGDPGAERPQLERRRRLFLRACQTYRRSSKQ